MNGRTDIIQIFGLNLVLGLVPEAHVANSLSHINLLRSMADDATPSVRSPSESQREIAVV